MTKILIKRPSKKISLPKYETAGSSGMDLAANIAGNINIDNIPDLKNIDYFIDLSGSLENDMGKKDLQKIEGEFGEVKIGSYPYFKPGNFGTSVVLRSANKTQLNHASKKVLHSIINLGGKGKILEENEIDERSL